jgi:hypothetical protein
MPLIGASPNSRDVRYLVAIEGNADIAGVRLKSRFERSPDMPPRTEGGYSIAVRTGKLWFCLFRVNRHKGADAANFEMGADWHRTGA